MQQALRFRKNVVSWAAREKEPGIQPAPRGRQDADHKDCGDVGDSGGEAGPMGSEGAWILTWLRWVQGRDFRNRPLWATSRERSAVADQGQRGPPGGAIQLHGQ